MEESEDVSAREVPIDTTLLSKEQLRFIVETVGVHSYFKWDPVEKGLVHKLGVRQISGEDNPILPIIRCDSLIVFEKCLFDDCYPMKIKGARFSSCTFRTFKGFGEIEEGKMAYSSHSMPRTLWDSDGFFEYPYGGSRCVMPSTGTEFVKCELDPRINDSMYHLLMAFVGKKEDPRLCSMYEKIWLIEIQTQWPEVFNDFMDSLTPAHFNRALNLLDMDLPTYNLYRKVNDKFL